MLLGTEVGCFGCGERPVDYTATATSRRGEQWNIRFPLASSLVAGRWSIEDGYGNGLYLKMPWLLGTLGQVGDGWLK